MNNQCEISEKCCDEVTNLKWQSINCEKILIKENFWISMTVPVKEDYELVVYHCDIEINKEKNTNKQY